MGVSRAGSRGRQPDKRNTRQYEDNPGSNRNNISLGLVSFKSKHSLQLGLILLTLPPLDSVKLEEFNKDSKAKVALRVVYVYYCFSTLIDYIAKQLRALCSVEGL